MMTNTAKHTSLAALLLVLAGCSHHDAYLQHAQQTTALQMPKDVAVKNVEPYYQVPQHVDTSIQQPSLIPPGSELEKSKAQQDKKQEKASAHNKLAAWRESRGEPELAMAETPKNAWYRVGKALRATDYQILDQDASMSSYYILDTSSTGRKITENTPIYRVFIKPEKQAASAVLLLSEGNKKVDHEVTRRILGTLAENLA